MEPGFPGHCSGENVFSRHCITFGHVPCLKSECHTKFADPFRSIVSQLYKQASVCLGGFIIIIIF